MEADSIPTITSAIDGTIPKSILHIQIEKNGRLELGVYDSFNPKSIFFGPTISSEFFNKLQTNEIMKPWTLL